jgi:hypothetical protein
MVILHFLLAHQCSHIVETEGLSFVQIDFLKIVVQVRGQYLVCFWRDTDLLDDGFEIKEVSGLVGKIFADDVHVFLEVDVLLGLTCFEDICPLLEIFIDL